MDFKFKDKELSLVINSTTHDTKEAKCLVKFDGVEHLYSAKAKPEKHNAVLAFEMAAQIAQEILGMDCDPSDFTIPQGGHMVQFSGYDSWGSEPETSKQRVKSGGFNNVASVEFYIRHTLLALEYETNGVKRTSTKQCTCI